MKTKLLSGIYVVVLLALSFTSQSAASGVFEIRLDEFVNQGGREQQGNCCEGVVPKDVEICTEPCKTAFRICFSHFQSSSGSGTECTFGSAKTPVLGENTIAPSPTGHPNSNLVRLNFNFTWPRAFSLVIEATHERDDESLGKVIARMEKSGSIGANTDWKTETQTQQEKILRYSYRVRCDQHYYGDGCSKYCRPRDDMFGHWTCDKNGEKVCLPGWRLKARNTKAYCLEPICLPGCNTTHGQCKRPNECVCRRGWKGTLCDECRTYPGCAHGSCHNSFECNCDPGWGGMLCNHDLNYCTNHNPCKNDARCTNVGQGTFSCECAPGFTGRECEIKMNECDPNPCLHGAKCTVQEVGYVCECPDNFFGRDCGDTHVTCATTPCKNGGVCSDDGASYRCTCTSGYRGVNCEIEDTQCPSTTCLNGGTCHGSFVKFTCSCPPGFSGNRCDIKSGICHPRTCKNGGKCSSISDGYRCECVEGFTGPRCEDTLDPCSRNPCRNGGECAREHNRYKCICPPAFTGSMCKRRSHCYVNPCKNSGKCVDGGTSYVCECIAGYRGKECEHVLDNSDSLQASYRDSKNTKIIVLTKNERPGLNTAQWITVCFASAFLLLIFIAVSICIAYHRYGKSTYTGGRLVKNHSLPRGTSENGGAASDRSSVAFYQTAPPRGEVIAHPDEQETSTLNSGVMVVPTQSLSPTMKLCYESKSTEFLGVGDGMLDYSEKRLSSGYTHTRPVQAYSHGDVRYSKPRIPASYGSSSSRTNRCFSRSRNEESPFLPTYQEACGDRQLESRVV